MQRICVAKYSRKKKITGPDNFPTLFLALKYCDFTYLIYTATQPGNKNLLSTSAVQTFFYSSYTQCAEMHAYGGAAPFPLTLAQFQMLKEKIKSNIGGLILLRNTFMFLGIR